MIAATPSLISAIPHPDLIHAALLDADLLPLIGVRPPQPPDWHLWRARVLCLTAGAQDGPIVLHVLIGDVVARLPFSFAGPIIDALRDGERVVLHGRTDAVTLRAQRAIEDWLLGRVQMTHGRA